MVQRLKKFVKQDGNIYGRMYPVYVEDVDGEEIKDPVSIVKEQERSSVHFRDMEIFQSTPGVSQIKMYDKRDNMGMLEDYRNYPHIETRLSNSCKYATLHCQLLCRFTIRCSEIEFIQNAGAELMKGTISNRYNRLKLRNIFHNFKSSFFERSPITRTIQEVKTL